MNAILLCLVLALQGRCDMPPPRPVATDIQVGCYYFPGHFDAARGAARASPGTYASSAGRASTADSREDAASTRGNTPPI